MKILLTGFEPFDGGSEQPLLCMSQGVAANGRGVELVTMESPVSFRRAPEQLLERMKVERPDGVICLGLAASRAKISLEKVGLNYAHARIPDNDGGTALGPSPGPSRTGGLFFHLAGFVPGGGAEPGRNSGGGFSDSGGVLCNCLLYRLLAVAGTMPAGFIHVPGTEKMALETMTQAVMQIVAFLATERRKREETMQYHFDELIDRRNTDSIKWDHIPENPDAIPMWVADMDFRCPKPVIDRVLEKAAFGVYAYTATPRRFRAAQPAGSAAVIIGTLERLW